MRDLRACLLLLALWLGWAVEARAGELSITVTGTPSDWLVITDNVSGSG